jgi:LmbE family N-acetylglucosaminyl deacetylase
MVSSISALKKRLKETEARLWSVVRLLLYALARDARPEVFPSDLLVIAPHSDDETLGCGVAIMRARLARHRVRVVIVTDGAASHRSDGVSMATLAEMRIEEGLAACDLLGVARRDVIFLARPDGRAGDDPDSLGAALREQIQDFKPSLVLYPSGLDLHPDHRAIADSVRGLAAEGELGCPAWAYPVWFWKLKTWADPRRVWAHLAGARLLRIPSVGLVERKAAALAAHRSQCENLFDDPQWEGLTPEFLRHFLGRYELFLDLGKPVAARSAGQD